jgi:hypothetical protein
MRSNRPKWLCRPKRLLHRRPQQRHHLLPELRSLQSRAVPFVGPVARPKSAARFTEWNTASSGALNANGKRLALASASETNDYTTPQCVRIYTII